MCYQGLSLIGLALDIPQAFPSALWPFLRLSFRNKPKVPSKYPLRVPSCQLRRKADEEVTGCKEEGAPSVPEGYQASRQNCCLWESRGRGRGSCSLWCIWRLPDGQAFSPAAPADHREGGPAQGRSSASAPGGKQLFRRARGQLRPGQAFPAPPNCS